MKESPRTLAQWAFLLVRPIFPLLQWLGRVSGLFTQAKTVEGPEKRQPYLLGVLKEDVDAKALETYLTRYGFHVNTLAYPDPGQVLSLRKLDEVFPDRQYHLRLFASGELRGHYELTPEDHPVGHMEETVFENRHEEFMKWLKPLLRD